MLFWFGFTLMVLNEGFVIMRHVHPWFANKRQELIDRLGTRWKRIHGTLDWMWIGGVTLGIAIDISNWKQYVLALGLFWGIVVSTVYLPMLIRKLLKIVS